MVGGGAAGLSAALVLGRARRRVAVIDAGEPRNAPADHMQGFLSRDGMPPALLAAARAEILGYGVELIDDRVVGHRGPRTQPGRRPCNDSSTAPFRDRSGRPTARHPGSPPALGPRLLHCPYCHGWEVRDEPIGVINTGAGSVDHAHLLRQWSDDVLFFTHTYPVTANERAVLDARGIQVIDGVIEQLSVVDDRLDAVQLTDGGSSRAPRSS